MPSTYEKIQTTTIGTATAIVDFTSIPGTYTDLVIVMNSGVTSGADSAYMRFNSDTGNNYNIAELYGLGSSDAAQSDHLRSNIIINWSTDIGGPTITSASTINIMSYAQTTYHKCVMITSGTPSSTYSSYPGISHFGNVWNNTSAITAIRIYTANTFVSGSTFSLYGIKAA